MVTRYSQCHFAEVFEDTRLNEGKPLYKVFRCSWCGKENPELVPMSSVTTSEIEVVLRRWKDGDTDFNAVVEKLDAWLEGSWLTAFKAAQSSLQQGTAKYIRPGYSYYFVKADDAGNDLELKDPEATDE
jgi:hypothetical protein